MSAVSHLYEASSKWIIFLSQRTLSVKIRADLDLNYESWLAPLYNWHEGASLTIENFSSNQVLSKTSALCVRGVNNNAVFIKFRTFTAVLAFQCWTVHAFRTAYPWEELAFAKLCHLHSGGGIWHEKHVLFLCFDLFKKHGLVLSASLPYHKGTSIVFCIALLVHCNYWQDKRIAVLFGQEYSLHAKVILRLKSVKFPWVVWKWKQTSTFRWPW